MLHAEFQASEPSAYAKEYFFKYFLCKCMSMLKTQDPVG